MSTIEKSFMYVCSFGSDGKWSVRKVNKVTSKTTAEHFISKDGKADVCDCKGFEHKGKCKHIEMVRGKFAKSKGDKNIPADKVEAASKFLDDYVKGHFDGARCKVVFREEVGDVAERFDILCEAEEKKVLWSPIMTPLETERGKGLSVMVRMIFSDDFDKNVKSF